MIIITIPIKKITKSDKYPDRSFSGKIKNNGVINMANIIILKLIRPVLYHIMVLSNKFFFISFFCPLLYSQDFFCFYYYFKLLMFDLIFKFIIAMCKSQCCFTSGLVLLK